MTYNKQDAIMTRGLAILCMIVLHLFCRKGEDVYGTPLLWIDETTPFVYWFGFFAGICVSLYSLCAGYAQWIISDNTRGGATVWKSNLLRIWKLLKNYWIVLFLFCGIGLLVAPDGDIPGSWLDFIKSVFLLHSYNGAWWYLNTYIILLLIPPNLSLCPIKKMSPAKGIMVCIGMGVVWYIIGRFSLLPTIPIEYPAIAFVRKEMVNLIGILPAFWSGAFLCKGKAVEKCDQWLTQRCTMHGRNLYLFIGLMLVFLLYNMLEKSVGVLCVTIVTFLIFNLMYKSDLVKKVFLFLGKHSTNIWLTHMFFYCCLFTGLTQRAKYPVFMIAFMLILCIISSYLIFGIQWLLCRKKIWTKQW